MNAIIIQAWNLKLSDMWNRQQSSLCDLIVDWQSKIASYYYEIKVKGKRKYTVNYFEQNHFPLHLQSVIDIEDGSTATKKEKKGWGSPAGERKKLITGIPSLQ
jgi:hypothetical protein